MRQRYNPFSDELRRDDGVGDVEGEQAGVAVRRLRCRSAAVLDSGGLEHSVEGFGVAVVDQPFETLKYCLDFKKRKEVEMNISTLIPSSSGRGTSDGGKVQMSGRFSRRGWMAWITCPFDEVKW